MKRWFRQMKLKLTLWWHIQRASGNHHAAIAWEFEAEDLRNLAAKARRKKEHHDKVVRGLLDTLYP
jgi:hypothetical protein